MLPRVLFLSLLPSALAGAASVTSVHAPWIAVQWKGTSATAGLAAAWLRSGTQMALRKDEVGGVRPAVMGCGLRRVAARLLVRRLLPALRAFCEPDNFAVGTPSGCQQVLVALRADSEAAVLDALEALDLRNAHNSFCRRTVEWVLERDEGLAPLLPMEPL